MGFNWTFKVLKVVMKILFNKRVKDSVSLSTKRIMAFLKYPVYLSVSLIAYVEEFYRNTSHRVLQFFTVNSYVHAGQDYEKY